MAGRTNIVQSLEVSELLSHTPGTPGVTGACRSGRFMCFGLWAYTWEVLTCQLLSLEGSTGSIYAGLQRLVKFLLPSTPFQVSGTPSCQWKPSILALPSRHHPRSSRDCNACSREHHRRGPASHQHSKPASCLLLKSLSPRSRPNQDQQPTVVAQPFTPGANATQNNLLDAVGSDSESS